MTAVVAALARAVAQLPDPSFRGVLWRGLGLAAAIYVGLMVIVHFALQVLQPEFTFVPISVSVGQYEPLVELGEALAKVVSKRMHEVLIVASSNMNHYEADTLTRWKDEKLLESILALDARGLFEGIRKYDVNMCGFASVVVLLTAARWLGAHSAELVRYATTGDITDSKHTVIGYAGVIVR